jgi:hypothetical protein
MRNAGRGSPEKSGEMEKVADDIHPPTQEEETRSGDLCLATAEASPGSAVLTSMHLVEAGLLERRKMFYFP